MKGQPEMSTDAIIAELRPLCTELERQNQAMNFSPGDRLSEDLGIARVSVATGVMRAVVHIERMRRRAVSDQADDTHGMYGRRKCGSDV